MTTRTEAPSDADLLETVSSLIGPAIRDQLWLFPLDDDGVPAQVVVPIEGVPMRTDAMPRLAEAIGEVGHGAGWASLVLVWERPGSAWLAPRESTVVAALTGALELPVRAAFLASDHGVRRLPGGTAA